MITKGFVREARIRVVVLLGLGVLAAVAILLHIFLPNSHKEVAFAVTVVGGLVVVYGGYFTLTTFRMNVEHNKKQSAFTALAPLGTPDMVKIRAFIEENVATTRVSPDRSWPSETRPESVRRHQHNPWFLRRHLHRHPDGVLR